MMFRRMFGLLVLFIALALTISPVVYGQAKTSDKVVKAKATADKIGEDGKQVVTITLEIDSEYHLYANPVGQADLSDNQTEVKITGKVKPESVKVEYPAGVLEKDKVVGDYKIYQGKVTIKAIVQRAKGDTGPLEATIKLQACTKKKCLLPGTIKVPVS